jgi:hypothetical protein
VPTCLFYQEHLPRLYKPFLQTRTSSKNRILFFPTLFFSNFFSFYFSSAGGLRLPKVRTHAQTLHTQAHHTHIYYPHAHTLTHVQANTLTRTRTHTLLQMQRLTTMVMTRLLCACLLLTRTPMMSRTSPCCYCVSPSHSIAGARAVAKRAPAPKMICNV